ncbi:hypothetical protein INT47_011703 [Mucor saturninus]|uniref:SPX domain-containing protein n=1 Tax=Mucor saturninus TaxID=64648 RepID=A0A8H7R347_9FUNG|nr:hypothetical protein INT47_011703 [Mucor saturninus]
MSFLEEFNENIYEPWHIEYVAYEVINKGLYEICNSGHWTSRDENDFEAAIRLEAGKVDLFINRKQREIESRLAYCKRVLNQKKWSEEDTSTIDESLTDILADINELGRFTRINFKALQNLIKDHDQLTNTNRKALLVQVCRARPLDNQRFDELLIQVSCLLDICRNRLESSTNDVSIDSKRIQTARYWVHQDNITEVKALLLFNLPMYVNNPAQEFEQTEHSTSAVYLDNNGFSEYLSRLQRDDGAEIIDIHWYGDMDLSHEVYIERQTYVKTDQGGSSVTDSIIMSKDNVYDFISHQYTAKDYANDLQRENTDQEYVDKKYIIAQSIQDTILKKKLEPKLRIYFDQLRFESPQDRTLSVALDSNIAFARENGAQKLNGEWRRQDMNVDYPFRKLLSHDLHLFPHAVLETQIVGGKSPLWLSRLLDSKLVYEVPRFSAYLHGVAQFWGPQLPLLPWWIPQMEIDIRTAEHKSGFSGITRSKSYKPLIDGQHRTRYLEAQLGKRQKQSNKSLSMHRTIYNRNRWNNSTDSSLLVPSSMDGKEKCHIAQQIENASSSSLHRAFTTPSLSSRTRLRDPNKDNGAFIDTYYNGRNNQSQAYMLQDANTVRESDNLREAAIIEMKEEKKKKKKEKKLKPPSHTMEPKLFFANERTFIHWLQFSAIILTAALTLLNFGDSISTISGIVFFCISLVIALYAFFRYRYRAHQMSTRPHIRYDDIYGPAGLCTLIVGAMIVVKFHTSNGTST